MSLFYVQSRVKDSSDDSPDLRTWGSVIITSFGKNDDPICLFIWKWQVSKCTSAIWAFLDTFYRSKLLDLQIDQDTFSNANSVGSLAKHWLNESNDWHASVGHCSRIWSRTDMKSSFFNKQEENVKLHLRSVDESNSKRLKVSTSTLYSDYQHQYYFYNNYCY